MTGFKRLCALLITAVLVITLLPAGVFADYQVGLYKIIPDNGVNLRSEPNGDKVGAIACGKTVTVTEVSGEWGKTTSGGVTGWFSLAYATYVGAVPDTPTEPAQYEPGTYQMTSAVNLRAGIGTGYSRLTTLPKGARVVVTNVQSGWGYTSYGDFAGWFDMQYAKKVEDTSFSVGTYAIGHPTTLREGADAASAEILTLPINATVEVTEVSGSWGKTTYKGKTGWFNLNNAATSTDPGKLTGDQRADIIKIALGELGNTDGTKYTYGRGDVAWCAYFVSWCARQAGIPSDVIKTNGYARAYYHVDTYYKSSEYIPSPGDLIYFDWSAYSGDMNHVGIVTEVKSDGTVCTVEGNTSNSVRERTYSPNSSSEYSSTKSISYYGVPNYNKAATPVSSLTAEADNAKGSVKVTFEATGASYYDVYVAKVGGNIIADSVARVRTSANQATLTGLTDGNYEVAVFARPGGADSKASSPKVAFSINVPAVYYELTVTDGTGGGGYAAGSQITVGAAAAAEGYYFTGWTATAGTLKDASSAKTTFTMPAGNATLTANYAKKIPVQTIGLTAEKTLLTVGESTKLTYIIAPDNATNKEIKWELSDASIGSVDKNVFTAKKAGTTKVWAEATDGSDKWGEVIITVKVPESAPAGESYTTTSALNMRNTASTSGERLLTIPKGTEVNVTEVSGNWGKTSYSGKEGWICLDYAKKTGSTETDPVPVNPAPTGESYTTTSALNLRSTSSTSGSRLLTIPKGTEVNVTEISGNWGKTSYSGKEGWICLDYAKKTGSTEPDPAPVNPTPTGENYTTTSALNLRSTSSTSGSRLLTIPKGTTISVTEVSGNWGKTSYSGKEGWICLDYAKKTGSTEPDPAPVNPTPTVESYKTTSPLNLRSTSSTSGTRLLTIPEGTTISVTEVSGNWGKTSYNGKTGWVCLDYAKKN